MFFEVAEEDELKKAVKVQCTNMLAQPFRDTSLRLGANIMVMGVGGAGRNAIRNMRAAGLGRFVELLAIDTDMGCDRIRYGKKNDRH